MSELTIPPESWLLIERALDQLELEPGATFLFHHVQRCMFDTGHPGADAVREGLDWAIAHQRLEQLDAQRFKRLA